jgi:hypothetical protein
MQGNNPLEVDSVPIILTTLEGLPCKRIMQLKGFNLLKKLYGVQNFEPLP